MPSRAANAPEKWCRVTRMTQSDGVQVFEGTSGIDNLGTSLEFTGEVRAPYLPALLFIPSTCEVIQAGFPARA